MHKSKTDPMGHIGSVFSLLKVCTTSTSRDLLLRIILYFCEAICYNGKKARR